MNRLKTFICAILSCLTLSTQAMAFDHPHVDRDGEKGNSDIKGGYDVYAGFLNCDAQDKAAADAQWDMIVQTAPQMLWPYMPKHICHEDYEQQYMKLEARAKAWVKLFGRQETIAYARARAKDLDGFKTTLVKLTAVGNVLFNDERDGINIERAVSFKEKKKYGMSGINVTVKGTASAAVGVSFNGGPVGKDIALYVTPYGDANASASASVGAGCASAGVEGSLNAIDAEIPAVLWASFDDGLTVDLDADLELKLLDGKLKVKLSYCFGDASKTIIDKDSDRVTIPLIDERIHL